MLIRGVAVVAIVCLLALAARADDLDLPAQLLRLGDNRTAMIVSEALYDEQLPRLYKNLRFFYLGYATRGYPSLALNAAENILAKEPLSPFDRLGFELIAAYGAMGSTQFLRARPHLAAAEKLATATPGAYGQVAQFLIKSWNFSLELESHPRMAPGLVAQRNEEAWQHLRSLPAEGRDELTSELYWVGEAYSDIWVPGLEEHQELLKSDTSVFESLSSQLGEEHPEASYTVLQARYRLGERLEDITRELYRSQTEKIYAGVRQQHEALLRRLGLQLSSASGSIALLDAENHRARADGYLTARNYPLLKQEWQAATDFSWDNAHNLKVVELKIDFFWIYRPPGWEKLIEDQVDYVMKNGPMYSSIYAFIKMYYVLGRVRQEQGRLEEAEENYTIAVGLFERKVNEMGGSPKESALSRPIVINAYEALAQLQLRQSKGEASLGTIDRLQQVQSSAAIGRREVRSQLQPQDEALLARVEDLGSEIRTRELTLSELRAGKASQPEIEAASALVAQTRDSYYVAVTELDKKYPAFGRLDIKPINFPKLQRALPRDTLVVLLFPTDEKLYLFEVTCEDLRLREVAITRAHLEELVQEARRRIALYGRDPAGAPLPDEPLTELYGALVQPLQPELQNHDVVAYIPYGSLVYLPFSALQSPQGYLGQQKQVVVLSKAADLDQIFGPPSPTSGSLVAFGNPDGTLAAASEEARSLARLFPGAEVFLEEEATPDKLKRVHAPQTSYLHLATHGILDGSDPRKSYLIMGQNQKLLVTDIVGFRLDSPGGDLSLVTLSACQTALAEKAGVDGSDLRSLADAFSLAGGRSLLATLWKVDDEATRDLMVSFYQHLKSGKSKAAALQAAQLELRKKPKFQHPFYWAPFILIGDWR